MKWLTQVITRFSRFMAIFLLVLSVILFALSVSAEMKHLYFSAGALILSGIFWIDYHFLKMTQHQALVIVNVPIMLTVSAAIIVEIFIY